MPDFDPRQAALHYAGEAERLGNRDDATLLGAMAQALTCGLVYVGDQLGVELLNIAAALEPQGPEPVGPGWTPADVAEAAGEAPQASRQVKVVSTTPTTVSLELDGVLYPLFAGQSLTVPGLTVTQVPRAGVDKLILALRELAEYESHGGPALVREIAQDALAEFERGGRDG